MPKTLHPVPVTIYEQQQYYDLRWAAKSYVNGLKLQRAVAILDGLARLKLSAPRILEVGCGTGWLTGMLGLCGDATGIDLSPRAIEQAELRFPYCTFRAADLTSTTLGDGFDVVVSHEVIEHIEDQPAHVAALAKALKPHVGHLILTTPNGRYPDDGGQVIEQHVTQTELRALLAPHFRIVDETTLILRGRAKRFPFLAQWGFGKHLFVIARRH